ncbi:uncharacterized protein LOC131855564 [Achroia grisella]|uniref:uncharacterized protein LOC131855564 n=1 Tax=Achroia grisella TaxID=688607 RepID=UPI0027D2FD0E|nr:uncharacterized protein LOC131855564 [Achroia grisella]
MSKFKDAVASISKDEDHHVTLLEAKKNSLFSIIQHIYDLSLKVSNENYKLQFLTRVYSLDKLRSDFIETLDSLLEARLIIDKTAIPNYTPLSSFDELYCHIKQVENSIKNLKQDNKELDLLSRKLPPLNLLKYDGSNPSKWISFYENFKTLIHDNKNLHDAEKVQYLIGCLAGKALNVCSGIQPTADNYSLLWNALVEKYQDVRIQASQYVDQMLQFKSNQTLDTFIEQFCSAESALRQLKIDNLSDYLFLHIALTKLDKNIVNLFEQTYKDKNIPNFSDLTQFVKEQCKIQTLRNSHSNSTNYKSPNQNKSNYSSDNKKVTHTNAFLVNTDASPYNAPPQQIYRPKVNAPSFELARIQPRQLSCAFCNSPYPHALFKCDYFINQSVHDRINIIKKNNLCANCLGFHNINACKSINRCYTCGYKHHSLLHIDSNIRSRYDTARPTPQPDQSRVATVQSATPAPRSTPSNAQATSGNSNNITLSVTTPAQNKLNNTTILLPTAAVHVYNQNKRSNVRLFLDSGSMSNFITKTCCNRLNLNITPSNSTIRGIGKTESTSYGYTTFKIHSRYDARCSYTITARVIDVITDYLPNVRVDVSQLEHLQSLPLADDDFYSPGSVDCLVGNELFPILLGSDKVTSPTSSVIGLETTLGYIVMGKADCDSPSQNSTLSNNDKLFFCQSDPLPLDTLTQRFWELESVPSKTHMSKDDEICENNFKSTYSRDNKGQYTVHLPFKLPPSKLGNSYAIAKRQYLQLEKKLDSQPDLRKDYNSTIQDYIDKGYLSIVKNPTYDSEHYYIPHRAVYRPDKQTSKTRIVLNAGCKTTSGLSLNDILYTGCNLQTNIFDLLMNLRMFAIGVTADIERMYFCIKLTFDHQPFQRILFRFNTETNIQTYQFNRVSFGVSSSPFLAMRVVRQLASDSRTEYPLAAHEADNHMYMDDYVSSLDGLDAAEKTYQEMINMFSSGGFKLVKWVSNCKEFMTKVDNSHKNPQFVTFDCDSNANTKIIGMQWNPKEDNFKYKISTDSSQCTKRTILSVTARLFDPLGLLGPITAFLKLLVQECWMNNLDWDAPTPSSISNKWLKFQSELLFLEQIEIPRHVGITRNSHVTLIGFADAIFLAEVESRVPHFPSAKTKVEYTIYTCSSGYGCHN